MIDPTPLVAAVLLGFFSSTHCIGMCGGIMGALTMAVSAERRVQRISIVVSYNLGRIASYTFMGALAGFFGYWLLAAGAGQWLRILAAVLLLLMGLYLANWWRALTWLEKLGQGLWRWLNPLGKKLLPVRSAPQGFLLGVLWGWLPCGLVYTALTYAMAQSGALMGALTMLAFGLGTLPAVLAAAFAATPLLAFARSPRVRQGAALLLIVFAGWTFYGAVSHGGHAHEEADAGEESHLHHQHH